MRTYIVKCKTSLGDVEIEDRIFNFREELNSLSDEEIQRTANMYNHNNHIELDRCPFCGTVGMLNWDSMDSWYGWCRICGCKGPGHYDWIKACRMWNDHSFKTVIENTNINLSRLKELKNNTNLLSEEAKEYIKEQEDK